MKSFCSCLLIISLFAISATGSNENLRVVAPDDLKPVLFEFLSEHQNLPEKDLRSKLKKYLTEEGFTFAQVAISKTAGVTTIEVKPGFMGKAQVKGNKYLDSSGILKNLDWNVGDPFNYADFYNQSSRLNRQRFLQIDSKLKPVRGHDGEIQVNADFDVKDQYPISPYVSISNDGTEQSSGWRSRIGLEKWETLMPNDRLNLAYTFDPKNSSQLSSYLGSYQFGSEIKSTIYAGYSDSKYENITSSSLNMDVAGDGFFAGFSSRVPIGTVDPDSLALTFGINYLDLSSQIYLGTGKLLASDEDLSLFLPKVGIQGSFANPFGLRGDGFWSLDVVSDLGSSDNQDLRIQNPELENGFWVPRLSLALLEPIEFLGKGGGLKLKVDGQVSGEPLPTSLKKSLGGLSSIRGYKEREAFGDSGVSMNLEYSLHSESTSLFGYEGKLQNMFFYDAGYVSNQGMMASAYDSVEMHSLGAGVLGNFHSDTDFSLSVGVPLSDTLDTQALEPRTHFSINFRF